MNENNRDSFVEVLRGLVQAKASDIFIIVGQPVSYKFNREIVRYDDVTLNVNRAEEIIREVYAMANREIDQFISKGDDDFSFSVKGLSRFRASTYRQRGSYAMVIRVVPFELPKIELLNIPDAVKDLYTTQRGLVLVSGASGNGKTTTLSAIINEINENRSVHVITLEDPIEYLHNHKLSIVSQREISIDTGGYPVALRAALRQSPDVILIGELRDAETEKIALTAAETGHLVLAALHTFGAANSIDRIVDSFPPDQQEQIRIQLSMVLKTVVSQQLIPTKNGTLMPVFEIMHCNNAIRTLIRDGRTHQINFIIQSSKEEGMISMDSSILSLYKKGIITKEVALMHSLSTSFMQQKLKEDEYQ